MRKAIIAFVVIALICGLLFTHAAASSDVISDEPSPVTTEELTIDPTEVQEPTTASESSTTDGGGEEVEVTDDSSPAVTTNGDTRVDESDIKGASEYLTAREILASGSTGKEQEKAVELLLQSASEGYAAAQSLLATLYAHGVGVDRSEAMAVLYHTIASLGGNLESHLALSHRYEHGIGVAKSCIRAVEHAKSAADAVAHGYTQEIRARSDVSRIDDESAVTNKEAGAELLELHTLRADKGNAQSCMFVGNAFMLGLVGAPQHGEYAISYFEKAIALGENAGHGALGQLYSQGINGGPSPVKPDPVRALKHFNRGAEANHPVSLNGMGYYYATGRASPSGDPDWRQAAQYFERSSMTNNAEGTYNLGVLTLNGRGVRQNTQDALNLFNKAAQAGSVLANYQIGNLMLLGARGASSECKSALRHFRLVNQRGRWMARLDEAKEAFNSGNYAQALLDYLTLAEAGIPNAKHNAAFILRTNGNALPVLAAVPRPVPSSAPATTTSSSPAASSSSSGAAASSSTDGSSSSSGGNEADSADATAVAELPSQEEDESLTEAEREDRARDEVLLSLVWRSALEGSTEAQLQLGDHYYYGRGTKADPALALLHYQYAANGGNAQAMFNLGLLYQEDGQRDFFLAKRHLDQALQTAPGSYFAVQTALLRLNFKWWWAHFFSHEETMKDVNAELFKKLSSKDSEEPSPANTRDEKVETPGEEDDERKVPRTWRNVHASLSNFVQYFNFQVWGIRFDDWCLFGSLGLGVVILLLRHNAFVM